MFKRRKKYKHFKHIDPDQIFLDDYNSPGFDIHRFEGRMEKPVSKRSIYAFLSGTLVVLIVFSFKLGNLQIVKGQAYYDISERNTLNIQEIFSDRGIIYDRKNVELAWNEIKQEDQDFPNRSYINSPGFGLLLGYVSYPKKDEKGFYWQKEFIGLDGLEKEYNFALNGKNGEKIYEKDALGNIISENVLNGPIHGTNLQTSIDAGVQSALYSAIEDLSTRIGYEGGTGALMDIYTGELIALTSYPEYNPQIMSDGKESEIIQGYLNNEYRPFLNRATSGLYSPGSTVKPFIALGALNEGKIDANTNIFSSGEVRVQNPYDPDLYSTFRDWKEEGHGWTDIVKAIGESVNTFFYAIGGGYENQEGLGITKIKEYIKAFSIGDVTGIDVGTEVSGVVPDPEWKKEFFDGDTWRLGDTYNTSIGQYGFQVTPIQMLRAMSAIANGGRMITPTIIRGVDAKAKNVSIKIPDEYYKLVRRGLRYTVTDGTGGLMNVPYVDIAAKTGTAQTGFQNKFVNSWSLGFFPYESPRYAFVVLMERGPSENDLSASFVVRSLMDWINQNAKEYLGNETIDE